MRILLTGGTGYIGSHTCVDLLEHGYDVVIADNLSNSKKKVLSRISSITGKEVHFYHVDLRDASGLLRIFATEKIDAVIHFAGKKSVAESVKDPISYYENNVCGSLALFSAMTAFDVKKIIFSSSATVYGEPESVPINEEAPLKPVNPYGKTKLAIEEILAAIHGSDPQWQVVILRYFNPAGAHESAKIGEDPDGIPNNLMPYICKVAAGLLPGLRIFGKDYPTPDGTGIRDYIHVMDLARGHVKALDRLFAGCGLEIYNLGTGRGYSVLEVVTAFEQASGKKIPYEFAPRRPGDVPECFADPAKAEKHLEWKAERGLVEMCADAWRWQKMNMD